MNLSDLVDTSTMESEYRNYHQAGIESKLIDATVANLKMDVGSFKADLNSRGFGTVELDGKRVKVREMIVHCRAGELTQVILHTLP